MTKGIEPTYNQGNDCVWKNKYWIALTIAFSYHKSIGSLLGCNVLDFCSIISVLIAQAPQ